MRQGFFIKIYLLLMLLVAWSRSVSCDADVIKKFFAGYDKAVRPDFDEGQATTIFADLYVESFGNIQEANMEYRVYTYFYQKWKDSRLAGKLNRTLVLKGADIQNIWVPDPYCYNARESNMMMPDSETHSSVSIKPSGDILYSKGVTLLASCNMDLRSFPHDSQACYLKFGSYSYTKEDIVFKWNATDIRVGSKQMAQFEYKGAELSSDTDVFDIGNYSTVTLTFFFKRRVGYYLIQVYSPDIFVVALSWIVFWMDKDDMGDRMALGITTILTIMFLLGSLNGNLPKVSYPKALDWYLLVSFSFVFMSLVECMIVFILNLRAAEDKKRIKCKVNEVSLSKRISSSIKGAIRLKKDKRSHQSIAGHNGSSKTASTGFEDDDLEMVNLASKADKSVIDDATVDFVGHDKRGTTADYLDKASRVLFPLSFITFNIVYWIYFSLFG
ncbi:gamma-aminobutyric acid receptor subunit alpha-6-like isoform X1 [Orbicella faveolata]|uniref:gamma-aminobutyric acid receptor subunit alpha-6-like isoform X1 n=1 Tax=Orbicella faveolata TaxID=48498 RepID=UPI0009E307E3|nr:gamma-aminobutyric acid receptor subunit alpha-6-like isoform X1 [Orbicella faveolata]XP_020607585.1 gamma-aminobutyric acid receptor subunit alpha-6-like isoform X1 [Orbicella faveolata]